jgi:transcriptional regulator with XRE-family HTH domain
LTETENDYIGIGLRRLRKERGWTQEELAGKCNLDPRTIQKLERNENSPTLNSIRALAKSFGMKRGEFLTTIEDDIITKYTKEKEPHGE